MADAKTNDRGVDASEDPSGFMDAQALADEVQRLFRQDGPAYALPARLIEELQFGEKALLSREEAAVESRFLALCRRVNAVGIVVGSPVVWPLLEPPPAP